MPWSGGSYTRPGGSTAWGDDRDGAVELEAGLHDTHDQDLAEGVNACLAKDGSNAATSNIDLGTNKLVNVTDPTAAQDAATKAYVDSGRQFDYGEIATTGVPTTETKKDELNITIPATWTAYDLVITGAGYVVEATASGNVIHTFRVRDGSGTSGTVIDTHQTRLSNAQPDNAATVAVHVCKVGETTTGALAFSFTAQADGEHNNFNLTAFKWSVSAFRTS